MEIIISKHFLPLSTPLFPKSCYPLNFRSIPIKNPSFPCSSLRKFRRNSMPVAVFCSVAASPDPNPCNYGGWEELELLDESRSAGKLDPFRSFLISLGIHDRKHAFMFVIGFVSALALSRVRFSSMAVLPVSILVFVAGFSAGLAQAGIVDGLVDKIGRKCGIFKEFNENLTDLGAFFSELDVKMSDLKSAMEGAIGSNHLEMGSLDNYLEIVEYVRSGIANTRKSMEGSFDQERGKKTNQKQSRKRREIGLDGFEFVRYLGGLFGEHLIGLNPTKAKDATKGVGEHLASMAEDNSLFVGSLRGNVASNGVEERELKPLPVNDLVTPKAERSDGLLGAEGETQKKAMIFNTMADEGIPLKETATGTNEEKNGDYMLSYDDDLNNLDKSLRFTTKQGSYEKMVFEHIYGQTSQNICDSVDHGRRTTENMDFFTQESRASSMVEQTFEIQDRSYFSSQQSKIVNSKTEQKHGIGSKQAASKFDDHSVLNSQQQSHATENGNNSLHSKNSTDEEFYKNVEEATNLLKQARGCMVSQADEETAGNMLYKSARLLSIAVALKPMSLLAVGQLGNTYLLHGELKLKISRELRTLLARSDALLYGEVHSARLKKLDARTLRREDVASVLFDICEEGEGLLVEAGRTYRKALSIDGNDIRALYNWGLALSFRAQLIADIGPEAAFDADKVYLAAIDKFNSMMSRSNDYAPEALYRWGVALQRRSQLRRHNSREKIKLLQQAKSLFEDVLCVESDNPRVKEALSSCISELNYYSQ